MAAALQLKPYEVHMIANYPAESSLEPHRSSNFKKGANRKSSATPAACYTPHVPPPPCRTLQRRLIASMHRRTPSETKRLRHLAAETAHAAPCHGDGASGAHLRSLRRSSLFALHVVRHVLWTASRSHHQEHRTSSPWPLIKRSYTGTIRVHRDTDWAKMATDNSLRGRRFRDTVPDDACPPPTQPGLPGSAFVPALTLIKRQQTHKGIARSVCTVPGIAGLV